MTNVAELFSIVAGSRTEPRGSWLDSTNPSRPDDVVARVALADRETFHDAAGAARQAQKEWAARPAPERARVLMTIARLADTRHEELAQLVTREVGKPIRQARFEANEFAAMFDYYGGGALRPDGELISSNQPDTQLLAFRAPLGVAALITTLNYPIAIPVWALAPALATGNAVVWKPDVEGAAVAQAVLDLLHEGGLPAGLVNLVLAEPAETYAGLELALADGAIDQLAFVGRTENGRQLGALAGEALLSPSLQLSGNNPLVLAPDGDLDAAVEAVRFSAFGVNQGCTAIRIAVVPADRRAEFVQKLEQSVVDAPIGDPLQEVLYGPMMCERYARRFEQALAGIADHHRTGGSSGVGRVTGSNPRAGFLGDPEAGAYYHPTVVDGVRPDDEIFEQEALGPMAGVTTYEHFGEAIELANATGYGYLASVFTTSPATAFAFRERINAGIVAVNRPTSLAGEQRVPMGGTGNAGNNTRLAGPWAVDIFTRRQAMSWSYGKLADD